MRTIRTKVYQFSELSEQAKERAIIDQINREITMIEDEHNNYWEAAMEMERMKTPWFLADRIYHDPELKQMIIDDIIGCEFEFKADGTRF